MTAGEWGIAAALVLLGYVVGSLSPSVFLGRAFRGIDLRQHGSGNAGTTNAFRVLGPRLGVAVLVGDILKGVAPVLVARFLTEPVVVVVVAFACVVGHNYSLFLRGHGGKGVATGAGAALAMMPVVGGYLFVVFAALVLTVRIVSVASITCTILFPILAYLLDQPLPYLVAACLMSALVLWAHRKNVLRLLRRQEPRFTLAWGRGRRQQSQAAESQAAESKAAESKEAESGAR